MSESTLPPGRRASCESRDCDEFGRLCVGRRRFAVSVAYLFGSRLDSVLAQIIISAKVFKMMISDGRLNGVAVRSSLNRDF